MRRAAELPGASSRTTGTSGWRRVGVGVAGLMVVCTAPAQNGRPWERPVPVVQQALSASEQRIGADELFAAAERSVLAVLEQRASRVELSLPREGLHGVVVAAGAVRLAARPLSPDASWGRRVSVWVDVHVDGAASRSIVVPVQVRAWQTGWVALRDMAVGTRLVADMLRQDEVDVAAGGRYAWQGSPDGQVLRSAVLVGQYLGEHQVMPPRAVARGDQVELVHRLGAVQVVASASALQDGDVGQHIQVRPSSSQAAVLARVIEPGKVELYK